MNPLFSQSPLNTSLSGASPLKKPAGPIPGAGLIHAIGNFFTPKAPISSSSAGNSPLMAPFAAPTFPGFSGVSSSMPGLPQLSSNQGAGKSSSSLMSMAPTTQGNNYASMSPDEMTAYLQSKPKPAVATLPSATPIAGPSVNDYQVGNHIPQDFNVKNTGNTFTSDKMSNGAMADLLAARQAKENAMNSGLNLDGSPIGMTTDGRPFIPSDSNIGQLANQLYQSKLYSPEQQSLIQGGQDLTAQINTKKLAERRKTAQLLENGTITREQATSFVQESERRANQELADLSVQQDSNTAKMTALGLIQQNQIAANQSMVDLYKPTEVAPGSTLFNPITGVMYQGNGASPATIQSTAQSLKQNDQMTGNLQLTPQGTVDDNYYFQKAQQLYASGGQSSNGSISGNQSVPGQLPQQVQTYLGASGGEYINDTRVPAGQRDIVKQLAAQNGIPYLEAGDVSSVQSIDYTKAALAKLSPIIDQILSDGAVGKVGNIAKATLNDIFPTSVARTAFVQNRDTAIKNIQSLVAGSGSGFRLTQPEIEQAVSMMPKQTDTLAIAKANLAWLNGFLDSKKSLVLTGTVGPQSNAPGLKTSGGSVINTKVGPVDNSWF